ncbi:MAG: hypothetical protein FJW76_04145 [Actinobacteria bacterium]|nr:hypothetical protein [Actinomycetota bacterium]
MEFSGIRTAAIAVAISLALVAPATAMTPSNSTPRNTTSENSTSERRFLQDDLTLISQFGGVIIGVNGKGDQFEGFGKGFNVVRSIGLGYPIFGSMRDDLSLIAKFGGVITGVNGPGDQYEGFARGFSVNRSLAAGYALPALPKPATPKPANNPTSSTQPKEETEPVPVVPKEETRNPGVYISPRTSAITEGFSLPISVSIVGLEAAKASLFLNDGNKSFLIEIKDVPRNGQLTFITPAAIGRYFVVLNTGERSVNTRFEVKPFGLTGILIMDATTPSTIVVPAGDLAVNWKIVLLRDGKAVQSRTITADNRGTEIRFNVPTGEARYTVQAEYEYQVRDARTNEVVTKLRVFEDPAGGAVLTRNPSR